jgi:cytochrome c oxidase subunit 2
MLKYLNIFFIVNIFLDSPKAFQFGFQDPASPIAEGLIDLHNYIFIFLIIVCSFVL